jgi:hypothetical protein
MFGPDGTFSFMADWFIAEMSPSQRTPDHRSTRALVSPPGVAGGRPSAGPHFIGRCSPLS